MRASSSGFNSTTDSVRRISSSVSHSSDKLPVDPRTTVEDVIGDCRLDDARRHSRCPRVRSERRDVQLLRRNRVDDPKGLHNLSHVSPRCLVCHDGADTVVQIRLERKEWTTTRRRWTLAVPSYVDEQSSPRESIWSSQGTSSRPI
jgi:hypothetical protein